MSERYYFKLAKLLEGQDGTANYNSPKIPCLGHSHARVSSTTSSDFTDAGGIDQTVQVQGSLDGSNWDTAIAGTTHTAANETKISSVLDIRGYAFIRLVYTANGCTDGTISATVSTIIG